MKLHFSDEEFWRSTPAIVFALVEQYDLERDFTRYQTGIIASTIINAMRMFGSSKEDPITPEMFVPRYSSQGITSSSSDELTEEDKLQQSLMFVRMLNDRMGGIDLRNEDKADI